MKWYIVWGGRTPGIYTTWEECRAQIFGFKGARYKSFKDISRTEAEQLYREGLTTSTQPLPRAISVDAACSGNPGVLEYRGVDVESREVLFASQRYPKGTNNMGEFLAIVHAMAWMQQSGDYRPIYTDSQTAMAWVRNREVKSTLPHNADTALLWSHIDRALQWLRTHDLTPYTLLKWETHLLGEIPADFGRK